LKLLDNKSINLLDVGCGNGTFLRYILSKKSTLKLTGIDLADNRDDKIHFIKGDFLKEELNEKFDVICSLVTIEHINSPHLFIQRIKNTLKPDGLVFIMTVNSRGLIYLLGELLNKLGITVVKDRLYSSHHLNHYSDRSLRMLMKMENFDILLQKKHNYSMRSVDVPRANIVIETIYRLSVLLVFLASSIFRCEYLQTIVCRKRG
jgi:2-polyprenyl-3-methyl-5-hydroxy-6-metoxy-1,4-benzoquinol methylase